MSSWFDEHWMDGKVPAPHARTFPIQRVASRAVLTAEALTETAGYTGELMLLHRAIFEARMEALKVMIRDGCLPVSDARINIIIEVSQRAVSDEAGDPGMLPESMHHLCVSQYDATSSLCR